MPLPARLRAILNLLPDLLPLLPPLERSSADDAYLFGMVGFLVSHGRSVSPAEIENVSEAAAEFTPHVNFMLHTVGKRLCVFVS